MNEETVTKEGETVSALLRDLSQEVTMRVGTEEVQMDVFKELVSGRVYPWGNVTYFHPDRLSKGVYLPGDIGARVAESLVELSPLRAMDRELTKEERKIVAAVVGQTMQLVSFSGAADYGISWITGDIAERRMLELDGTVRDVLVVPQGMRRAKITAEHFQLGGMKEHPLAGNDRAVLEAMVKTMVYSDLAVPYHRGKAFADGRNPGVIVGDVRSLYVATTWDFSPQIKDPKMKAPYRLPRVEKIVLESGVNAFTGHPKENLKATWRYALRISEHCDALQQSHEGKTFSDKVFFSANGLPVDMVYTNLIFCGKDPQREGTLMVFPEVSEGNYFFQGKTQATVYELVERFGDKENIRVSRACTPEEFAEKFGYQNRSALTGRELSNAVIMEKVELMLAPGTFRGPQWVHGYKPKHGDLKMFAREGACVEAANTAIRLYNDAVWALRDGVRTGESCIAADPRYCTLFDVAAVREGFVEPLSFRNLGSSQHL